MTIDFNNLFTQLKTAIVNLAKDKLKDLAAEAASDGTSLLLTIKADLKKYTKQLQDGEIDNEDFKLLLSGDNDLVEMSALTQAGLSEAAADAFKTSVFETITNTVFALI
jgi:methanogenic corrinoid protein MtbC1